MTGPFLGTPGHRALRVSAPLPPEQSRLPVLSFCEVGNRKSIRMHGGIGTDPSLVEKCKQHECSIGYGVFAGYGKRASEMGVDEVDFL